MGNCSLEKGCKNKVQYVCWCLNSETFYCKIHLNEHLKTPNRNHVFDSISSKLQEWSKDGLLQFLSKEKLKKEELMMIVLDFFSQNSFISINIIEKYLNELDSKCKDINDKIEKISQVSEKDLFANPWILQLDFDVKIAEDLLPTNLESNWLYYKLRELKNKRLALLNRVYNDHEAEQEFRRTCVLYEKDASNILLRQAYKKYVKDYQRITSLYLISRFKTEVRLLIYDTENQREEMKVLKNLSTDWATNYKDPFGAWDDHSVIQIPNGELFIYKSFPEIDKSDYAAGIVNIFDKNCQIRYLLRGTNKYFSTAIYFNKNIYCFGHVWKLRGCLHSPFSTRYVLDENRWIELAPIEKTYEDLFIYHFLCSAIFNGNILFSVYDCNLFLYSIDINSFSAIPYQFAENTDKTLISVEERLYLIECAKYGWIYESEVRNEYNWEKISISKIHDKPCQFYSSYNKGEIFLAFKFHWCFREYFKFNLDQKKLIEIACYGDDVALESSDSKPKTINYCGQTIKLDSYYNKLENHPFYIALRLQKVEEFRKKIARNHYYDDYKGKANVLRELGKNLEAIECYNQAIKKKPDLFLAFCYRAYLLADLGREKEAIQDFNRAYDLELQFSKKRYNYERIKILIHTCLELLKMLAELVESAVKVKEQLQEIKNLGLRSPEIINEAEEKEKIFKEQRSQLIKRAVECIIIDNNTPIEKVKQMKIEVAEHKEAIILMVNQVWYGDLSKNIRV